MNDKPEIKTWSRDPYRQSIARDLFTGTATYARACTASREYTIVKVPMTQCGIVIGDMLTDTSGLNEDDLRFVEHNITKDEWRALNGEKLPPVDRSR